MYIAANCLRWCFAGIKFKVSFAFTTLSTQPVNDGLTTKFLNSCDTTVVWTTSPFGKVTLMSAVRG
jgi:hypothetical protein